MDPQDLQDLKATVDQLEQQDQREMLEMLVNRVMQDHRDLKDLLVRRVNQGLRVSLEHWVLLDPRVRTVIVVQPVHKVSRVTTEHLDKQDHWVQSDLRDRRAIEDRMAP